ncbi:hypothetical protein MUK42_37635 [Musa troglodytarum]|uniref:Uncharacterized protein n=1 Tax=Musa troglodytarum TaxID=320322 RepID=A0A9E7JA95_9LILI|nr:hypothetical protein MUK42_37635 [Musa troglodytarum]
MRRRRQIRPDRRPTKPALPFVDVEQRKAVEAEPAQDRRRLRTISASALLLSIVAMMAERRSLSFG